jgi:hypothetical protein
MQDVTLAGPAPQAGCWKWNPAGRAGVTHPAGPGIRAAYPGSTWDRLVVIKGRDDPTNPVRVNRTSHGRSRILGSDRPYRYPRFAARSERSGETEIEAVAEESSADDASGSGAATATSSGTDLTG